MRVAIILSDTVENIIEAESLASAQGLFPAAQVLDADTITAGIGWRLVEGEWHPPTPLAPVLSPLTRRRLRLGLLSIGIRSADIEAVIAAIPDAEAREWAMIEWQDASEYERDHPLIADAMAALDLPAEQVDTLWLWAAGL